MKSKRPDPAQLTTGRSDDLTKDIEKSLAIEVDQILHGNDAHRRGHVWFERGYRDLAISYLHVAVKHDVAAAENDLTELARSGNSRTATCADTRRDAEKPLPSGRRATAPQGFRQARWHVTSCRLASMTVLAAICTAIGFAGAIPVAGPFLHPEDYEYESAVPTVLSDETAGKETMLELRSTSRTRPPQQQSARGRDKQPPAETGRPATPTTSKPKSPATAIEPVSGPHVQIRRIDENGRDFEALVPIDGQGEWRQVRFPTVRESNFVSILWSADRAPCTWRFIGLDETTSTATDVRTDELVVPARKRSEITLPVHEWPILSAQVRGGDSPESCLLVNYGFTRDPTMAEPDTTFSSPKPSPPTTSPTPPITRHEPPPNTPKKLLPAK